MIRLILLLVLAFASPAAAASLTEAGFQCDKRLVAELEDDGTAHVTVQCVTFDASGAPLRSLRGYDVTNRLTAQQRAAVLLLLQQIPTIAANQLVIPTPAP